MGSELRSDRLETNSDHAFFDEAGVGQCTFDRNLRFMHVNPWLAAVHGAEPDDHLGRRINDINVDIAFDLEPRLKSVVRSGETSSVVVGIVDLSATPSSIRNFQYRCFPIPDEKGETKGITCIVEEITGTVRQHLQIRDEEVGLQSLVSGIPVGISYFDTEERFRFANRQYRSLLGIDRPKLIGMALADAIGPLAYEVAGKYVKRVLAGEAVRFENTLPGRAGHEIDIQVSYVPDLGVDSQVHGFFAMVQDVTDRNRSQTALKEANENLVNRAREHSAEIESINRALEREIASRDQAREQFLVFLESTPDPTIVIDGEGRINLVNSRVEGVLGYSPEELAGKPIEILVPSELKNHHVQYRVKFQDDAAPRMMGEGRELVAVCKDGSRLPVEISLTPAMLADENLVIAHIRDVSAEKEIRDTVLSLSARLLHAQEDERSRIARELHDDFSQRLALLAINLGRLKALDEITKADNEHTLVDQIDAMQQSANEISVDINRLSHQLHPPILDHIGLSAAVNNLCKEHSALHDIEITLEAIGEVHAAEVDISLCLYRIAQEALWNVVRHSEAKLAEVVITYSDDETVLSVTDNGKGFDQAAVQGKGLGLVSMRERLLLVSGAISVTSVEPSGTRIEVRVPKR